MVICSHVSRLWYQLTKSCEGLFSTNGVPKTVLIALFNQFIRLWSKSMNQLAYTKMAVKTAELMGKAAEHACICSNSDRFKGGAAVDGGAGAKD